MIGFANMPVMMVVYPMFDKEAPEEVMHNALAAVPGVGNFRRIDGPGLRHSAERVHLRGLPARCSCNKRV